MNTKEEQASTFRSGIYGHMDKFNGLKSVIDSNDSFIITAHQNPDADAAGSELGLARYIDSLGKTAIIINSDPLPPHLAFMDTDSIVRTADEFSGLPAHDIILSLDTAVMTRFPGLVPLLGDNEEFFTIDHHIPGPDTLPGYIDINASSTGEILYHFFRWTGTDILPQVAEPLLYAVGGDTGWMRFANTTPDVVRIMADLSETAGLPMHKAFSAMHYSWTEEQFRLYLDIMGTLEIRDGIAMIYCEQDFLTRYPTIQSISEVSDSLSNDLKKLGACPVSIFLKQAENRKEWRVSFRSTSDVDVQKTATSFGGGGHRAASGCTITGHSLDEVKNMLIAEITKAW
jgi:phosphoesterase RecJ-like protein